MVSSGFRTVELSTFLPINAEMIEFLAIDDFLVDLLKIVLNTTSRRGSKSGIFMSTPYTLVIANRKTASCKTFSKPHLSYWL
jgi:hypothetical protein